MRMTRQQRLFEGFDWSETRIKIRGGIKLNADHDLNLGDTVQFLVTGHVVGGTLLEEERKDAELVTIREYVVKADNVKVDVPV